MSSRRLDLFVEDRGHEQFIRAMLKRLAREENLGLSVKPWSARGGHPRVMEELKLYQRAVQNGATPMADAMVVAIDANCRGVVEATRGIRNALEGPLAASAVIACPDPHVERWYMADPPSFREVVGSVPALGAEKCERRHYKRVLMETIRAGGQIPTLGGIEFADELVARMDLDRAGNAVPSLGAFIADTRVMLRR
jgi:hypothetical protein